MNIKKKFLRRLLAGALCSALLIVQAVPVFATDEYGAPLVTATPTPDPHTAYYKQAADTDSIKNWVKGPQIEGESAILADMFTGAVLYSKNADKAQYPASITKIMTALLGCENLESAIHLLHPWAVDLSSSVETDGHKDPDKIIEAVYAVRNIKEDF